MQVRQHLNKLRWGAHVTDTRYGAPFRFMWIPPHWYYYLTNGEYRRQNQLFLEYCLELLEATRLSEREVGYFAQNLRMYGDTWEMARNGSSKSSRIQRPNAEFTWVSVELTDADYDQIDSIEWSASDVLSSLTEIVRTGYSVATKLDVRTGSVACHLTCNQDGHKDCGFGITGYADDLETACIVALFKLDSKCGGSLSDYKSTKRKYR